MARPAEFDRDRVLEQAMEVFWEKGFEATSLLDLIESMGLSKSSFYQAFSSKHDLFVATLERYTSMMASEMSNALDNATSGTSFLENVFLEIANNSPQKASHKGCMLMNTASEFAQTDQAITTLTQNGMKRFETIFAAAVRKGQATGEIAADKDPNALGYFLVCSMSGLKTMAKAGIKPAILRPIVHTIIDTIRR